MDPTYPDVDKNNFPNYDRKNHYKTYSDEMPSNAPEPLGLEFIICAFINTDHAGETLTRRSRTGFLVSVNSAVIYLLSKKQSGVKTSSFGSEFLAMKHSCEYIRGLRYTIHRMGIPMTHNAFV